MANYSDDSILLLAVQQYEPEAEVQLFKRFFRPLCLFAERLTGSMPAAEDIVSEAFVKAFSRRSEFLKVGNFKAFLYVCVRNAGLSFRTINKNQRRLFDQLSYIKEDGAPLPENVFQNEIMLAGLVHDIYLEIENLPSKCRRIFKMVFFESLSTEAISIKLGINAQTVRTQKARALMLLKTKLLKKAKFPVFYLLTLVFEAWFR